MFGTVVMLLLVATNIYIFFFHRKKMAIKRKEIQRLELEKKLLIFKSASEAEERERERIARNLHDEINLMLAVHKQILEKHGFEIESNEFDTNGYQNEIENIEKIREAVTACATNLVPAFLLKNGLTQTLEDHIRQINTAGKLKARCNVLLPEKTDRFFDKQEELNIYRICLELINNILKHSLPKQLTLTISTIQDGLFFQIDHDGELITNTEVELLIQHKKGLGLKSIRARSLILNAEINYSDNKIGPAVSMIVPISHIDTIEN